MLTPEICMLWVLGSILLMTAVNRLTVQGTNWLARGLSSFSYFFVGFSGLLLAPCGMEMSRTMEHPILGLLPIVPWFLCMFLAKYWLRLTPPPQAT